MIHYGELPKRPRNNVHMECAEGCEGEWSAWRDDYFLRRDDDIVRCVCGAPLILVAVVVRYEEITPREAEA